MKYIVKIESF